MSVDFRRERTSTSFLSENNTGLNSKGFSRFCPISYLLFSALLYHVIALATLTIIRRLEFSLERILSRRASGITSLFFKTELVSV